MLKPLATYRVQLHKDFNFKDLNKIIPYLDALGVDTIYAAPFFHANPGSNHGYDVLNPHTINPEIGTLEEFRMISRELKARSMKWLQDIVPNHMAFSPQNPWLVDMLEKGPHSQYYRFFDIDWQYPEEEFTAKLMLPVLGAPLEEILAKGEIKITQDERGIFLSYYEHSYPISLKSFKVLVENLSSEISKYTISERAVKLWAESSQELISFVNDLPAKEETVIGWEKRKELIAQILHQNSDLLKAFEKVTKSIQQNQKKFKDFLDQQFYRFTYWKVTEQKINYRRFFTVNDLICLNMQDKLVFETYHRFIKDLIDEDLIQGVRVDHVDGLLDPSTYLENLRELLGNEAYIIVEKILEGEEVMPSHWPIQGTSGYEYLAMSNQLFTDKIGSQNLLSYYREHVKPTSYEDIVYQNKSFILDHRMRGELDNLHRLMCQLKIVKGVNDKEAEDCKKALAELLKAFPVYRVYGMSFPFLQEERTLLAQTIDIAESKAPSHKQSFDLLREIYSGKEEKDAQSSTEKLKFVMRSQQFTGPLAAKGVEDTTFYQYFPLISHNEVGDSPEHLGLDISEFHQKLSWRESSCMNTTATHDTKRGEDARMRLNVLSEIPEAWLDKIHNWQELNKAFLKEEDQKVYPDQNDEYFLYQTLIATYPFHISPEDDDYTSRLEAYLIKAIREAKVHTNWANPDEAYENAFTSFAQSALENELFMQSFIPFAMDIATSGAIYSLGQTLLKLTVPGVPDTYQGTEYWDLSMVDPDNRRAVDYIHRENLLHDLEAKWRDAADKLLTELCAHPLDPQIKLFVTAKTLHARKLYAAIFEEGEYEAVKVDEGFQDHIIAFKRVLGDKEILVVIPLRIRSLDLQQHMPLSEISWNQCSLDLGESAGEWYHIFANKNIQLDKNASVASLLETFPLALMIKE